MQRNRASFIHVTSIYANLLEQKKRVQLPQDWFGTPTWPPFYSFYCFFLLLLLWSPLRHMKTLYTKQIIMQYNTIQ